MSERLDDWPESIFTACKRTNRNVNSRAPAPQKPRADKVQKQGQGFSGHIVDKRQGGHMANKVWSRGQSGLRADTRRTRGGQRGRHMHGGQAWGRDHIAASLFFLRGNPTVNCLGNFPEEDMFLRASPTSLGFRTLARSTASLMPCRKFAWSLPRTWAVATWASLTQQNSLH